MQTSKIIHKIFSAYFFLFFILLTTIKIETNAQGVIKWENAFGGNHNDLGFSITQSLDGGFAIIGYTSSEQNTGDFNCDEYPNVGSWFLKLNSDGALEWQKCLTFNSYNRSKIKSTKDGGYIIIGSVESEYYYADGAHGSIDYWIMKLSALGEIQWQKFLGGADYEGGYYLALSLNETLDGGYIFGGNTYSNDGDVSGNHGNSDLWAVKMDSVGNIEWQKCFGGSGTENGGTILQLGDGSFIISGTTINSNDGDVSGNHGFSDVWVAKMDTDGNLQWQKCFGGTDIDYLSGGIVPTDDHGYVICGDSKSNDGDVSGNHGGIDYWIFKIDSSGSLVWQHSFGGPSYEEARAFVKTLDGGFAIAGWAIDEGGDVSGIHGSTDFWIVKLSSNGNLEWQKCLGSESEDYPLDMIQSTNGNLVVVGEVRANNGDVTGFEPGPYCYGYPEYSSCSDYWVVSITSAYNSITGKLFFDGNSNNIQDAGELPLTNKMISETGTGKFSFPNLDGNYAMYFVDSGDFIIAPPSVTYYNPVPATQTIHFDSLMQVDSLNDFAYQPLGVFNDLCVSLNPTTLFRSNTNAGYSINYENVGNTTINNATVVFYLDDNVNYVSSSANPTLITPDSIVWNIGTIAPFQTGSINVTVLVNNVLIGTAISSTSKIEPIANDANPACNSASWNIYTTGSYDPNNILVDKSFLLNTEFPNPPYLEYIIQFQNTGNDTAFNIKLFNTIDTARLLANTFELVESSHPVTVSYFDVEKKMLYQFDNILLPDSNVNEPLSHGFIRYRIKPVSTLIAGDTIKNSASVFFDFNAPVATNDAETEIVLPVSINDLLNEAERILNVFPNPAYDKINISLNHSNYLTGEIEIKIFDVLGRLVYSHKKSSPGFHSETIDISKLTPGLYSIELNSGAVSCKAKFVKQ